VAVVSPKPAPQDQSPIAMADTEPLLSTDAEDQLLPLSETPIKRRRRRVMVKPADEREVVRSILDRVNSARMERSDWNNKRLARYAKLRGWLEREQTPWDGASNQHIPIMLANSLRVKAGLFNAVLGIRPVMTGKPDEIRHKEMAQQNDFLLDHQMFVDQPGDRLIEKYIDQFVDDGTVFSFQPHIRERRTLHDVRVLPRPSDDMTVAMQQILPTLTEENRVEFKALVALDATGYRWRGIYDDAEGDEQEVPIEIYDRDDKKIEVIFEWEAITYEGPAFLPTDIEDIVAPMRVENLQPVTGHNPTGAPWVDKISRVDLDTVRRRAKDGIYDYLTEQDLDDLAGEASAAADPAAQHSSTLDENQVREAKDAQAGLESLPGGGEPSERRWVTVHEWYGPHDANDDSLDEQVIITIIEESGGMLARARYLSEMYPGLPPIRPFSEARFVPVPGQLYGMGLPELMEGLNDFIHDLINENVDAGRVANMPWFGYRASSGFKPDTVRMEPGMGIPLDNPQQDLAFYSLPHSDQQWSFNMIGLGMQFLDRLTQIGPLQAGQVPQGKASALRTLGTTMAILQQGAAMPEQILRRLMMGLRDVFAQFHLLNTRYLPPKKRFLLTGRPMSSEDAYGMIDDRKSISIPLTFDFQATLLNTNKGVVTQALESLGAALINPLMIQLGLVTPEQIYNWAHDVIQSHQQDPSRYIKRPPGVVDGPRITAEEAILDISRGLMPSSTAFVEPTAEAAQKLMGFMQSDEFGFLTGSQPRLFQQYLMKVLQQLAQEQQQMQLAQAAASFNKDMGGKGGGDGRTGQGAPPEMQTEAPSMDEQVGAEKGAAA
jgi:hypothetical protein